MNKHRVAIVKYEKPLASLRRAVELAGGLERIGAGAKVFVKPNVVYWTKAVPFPKWGVITTSRMVQDAVELLAEHGVRDITIGEGMVRGGPGGKDVAQHAFNTLGYGKLAQRFGVKVLNIFDRPFEKVDLDQGMALKFNRDILHSDFVVDLPVLKAHAQTVVSLAIKNLKGMLDIDSRKRCHSADPQRDLHHWVSRLADPMPPILAIGDGIYTAERGPAFDGTMHRADILTASWDILSADMVGAKLLGMEPDQVPYLVNAARRQGRPLDLSDVEVMGEAIADHARHHEWEFPYNPEGTLPLAMAKKGIKGVSFYRYDDTMCTYCSGINGVVLASIAKAWGGEPWDQVEVLTGKMMQPRPGAKKTILLGKCMYQAHKDNPDIAEMIPIKGCPPKPEQIVEAMHRAGIMVDPGIFHNLDKLPSLYLKRYAGKPEFDERLFQIE